MRVLGAPQVPNPPNMTTLLFNHLSILRPVISCEFVASIFSPCFEQIFVIADDISAVWIVAI